VKYWQKTVSIEEKLDVISRLAKGEQIFDIYHNVGLILARTVRNNADRIKGSAKSGTRASAKRICYSRSSTMECMEKMLSTWTNNQNQHHIPVSMLLVKDKAHSS